MSREPQVHPTAIVGDDVALGPGVRIGPFAIVEDGVAIGADTVLHARAFVGRGTTLGEANQLHPGAVVGHLPQDLGFDPDTPTFTRIGDRNVFREYSQVHRATREGEATVIGDDNMFMALAHVAHDCRVGSNVVFVNQASLAGHCEVGDRAFMAGLTGMHQFCRVGRLAMVAALSVCNKDVPPFMTCDGRPARARNVNVVGLRRAGLGRQARTELREAFRILYRAGLTIPEACDRIEAECASPEAAELVAFVRSSERGILKPASEGHGRGRSGEDGAVEA